MKLRHFAALLQPQKIFAQNMNSSSQKLAFTILLPVLPTPTGIEGRAVHKILPSSKTKKNINQMIAFFELVGKRLTTTLQQCETLLADWYDIERKASKLWFLNNRYQSPVYLYYIYLLKKKINESFVSVTKNSNWDVRFSIRQNNHR